MSKVVTCALMLYGVLFTAMPLTIIGTEFVEARRMVDKARRDMRHGPAWAVRHSEFESIATSLTAGNKMDVYHVVSDHYVALGSYLDLLRRLVRGASEQVSVSHYCFLFSIYCVYWWFQLSLCLRSSSLSLVLLYCCCIVAGYY